MNIATLIAGEQPGGGNPILLATVISALGTLNNQNCVSAIIDGSITAVTVIVEPTYFGTLGDRIAVTRIGSQMYCVSILVAVKSPQPPACELQSSAAQSIGNNAIIAVTMNVTNYDSTGTMADLVNSRIIIPVDGLYLLWGRNAFPALASPVGTRGVYALAGPIGSQAVGANQYLAPVQNANTATITECSRPVQLHAGDVVSLSVFQNQGSTQVNSTSNGNPVIGVAYMRPRITP